MSQILVVIFLFLLTSCLDTGNRSSRPRVIDFTQIEDTVAPTCDETTQTLDTDLNQCVDKFIPSRPTNDITYTFYCACQAGKPIISNNCVSYCASRNDTNPTLIINFNAGTTIQLNEIFSINGQTEGSVQGWCINDIGDGLGPGSCNATFSKDDNTSSSIASGSISFSGNPANSLSIDLSGLNYSAGDRFLFNLTESTSGSTSKAFGLEMIDPPDDGTTIRGPLSIMPINQYTCIQNSGTVSNSGSSFDQFMRLYFYFPVNSKPSPLPPGDNFLYCHDKTISQNDNSSLERLEVRGQVFALWDREDPRFFSLDGESGNDVKLDIHNIIEQRLLDEYNKLATINFFQPITLPKSPNPQNIEDINDQILSVGGFVLIPFIDEQSDLPICPTQDDYDGPRPEFRVLKDLIGVDTEALYLAESDPQVVTLDDGSQQVFTTPIFIRESELKQIWFYSENNIIKAADEISATNKQIQFFYPPDTANPYTRKPNQIIYNIRADDSCESAFSNGVRTSRCAPDKRIACIPAVD